MQIKIFTVPILGGERIQQELNEFLRSKKILAVKQLLTQESEQAFWTFCIQYLDDRTIAEKDQQRIDYREVLDEETFNRFAQFREIRRRISTEEKKPPYVVFTDAELAILAGFENLTLEDMKNTKGIGEKKVEKYGAHFATRPGGEKG